MEDSGDAAIFVEDSNRAKRPQWKWAQDQNIGSWDLCGDKDIRRTCREDEYYVYVD
jgi:hypothetical protein